MASASVFFNVVFGLFQSYDDMKISIETAMCNIRLLEVIWRALFRFNFFFSLSFNGKCLYKFVFVCILYKFDLNYAICTYIHEIEFLSILKQGLKISTKFQHTNWVGSEKLFIRSFPVTFDSIKWANTIIKIHSSNSILFFACK